MCWETRSWASVPQGTAGISSKPCWTCEGTDRPGTVDHRGVSCWQSHRLLFSQFTPPLNATWRLRVSWPLHTPHAAFKDSRKYLNRTNRNRVGVKIKDSFTKTKIEVIIVNKSVLWNIPHTDASSMYLETCLKDKSSAKNHVLLFTTFRHVTQISKSKTQDCCRSSHVTFYLETLFLPVVFR